MDPLLPLVVVTPLAAAAVISLVNFAFENRRRLLDLVAIATAVAVSAMLLVIVARTGHNQEIYWFSGFRPSHNGVAIGIDFSAGRLNAGLAALTALLVTASMLFSWRYFERASTWYHALMLVFLAGMVGFCLTGDIFDLFVWFELMGVSAYALTAYRPEEKGPVQGALNFAVTNSVAAYLSLSGIALLYARTGALNMAQIGHSLGRKPPDGLVIVAFVLVLSGLLAKGAIVPFHFWLADAHAVAPTPVCVLFSGVMVELGLYGIARVYWSVFGEALGGRQVITNTFLVLGAITAVVGAVFCFRQRHLKRLLAFSTISHAGMFLLGFALLTPLGLAGAAAYVAGHAFVKAALFISVGIVLHRLGSVNETKLHGKGRRLRATGVIFTLAALGLAGLPPFGTFLGSTWIGDSGSSHGQSWITWLVTAATVVTGAAVLRVAGGVFYGLGVPPSEDPHMASEADEEKSETDLGKRHTPLTMAVPAAVLVAGAIAFGLWPHLGSLLQNAVLQLQDQRAYQATVLHGASPLDLHGLSPVEPSDPTSGAILTGIATCAGAVALALLALYRHRLPRLSRYQPNEKVRALAWGFQSGVINDYVAWLVLGIAGLGAVLALALR